MPGAHRAPGLSVRVKLTLSYAGFLVVAGIALFAVGFLLLAVRAGGQSHRRRRRVRAEPHQPRRGVRPLRLVGDGPAGGLRPRRRLAARRRGAAPTGSDHGCRTASPRRSSRPPRLAARPSRRADRPRRHLRRDARSRAAHDRRGAPIRRQRLARAAHAARDHPHDGRGRSGRSGRARRRRRPAADRRDQRPRDRLDRGAAHAGAQSGAVERSRCQRSIWRRSAAEAVDECERMLRPAASVSTRRWSRRW